MSIEKIGSTSTLSNITTKSVPKVQQPVQEKAGNMPQAKTEEAEALKNATKVIDPPFLPIGDTWSIFEEIE